MSFDEYELAVVRKAMGRGNGCCERDAAKGLDGVSVELSVGLKSVHRSQSIATYSWRRNP